MSATGFVIAFMLCGGADECETIALRAARYHSIAHCQAALPEALGVATRVRPDHAIPIVQCRSLAEVCPMHDNGKVVATRGRRLAQTERIDRSSPGIAAVLAVLCAPPLEQGC